MKRTVLTFLICLMAVSAPAQELDAVRPIAALDRVWLEEMTWMEVRDAIKAGKTTVIVGTGGVEQNGPYVVNGKHNYNLKMDADAVARGLGNALVAPIVTVGPSNWSKYPGTLALRRDVFKMVLADICSSLKQHGFRDVILIGDNGGNQPPMKEVAEELNAQWNRGPTRVHHLPEYYATHDLIDKALPTMGIKEQLDGIHHSYRVTALLLLANPEYVRLNERTAAGKTTVNGINILPSEKMLETAKKLLEMKTNATVEAIRSRLRPGSPSKAH